MNKRKGIVLGIVTILLVISAGTLAYRAWDAKREAKQGDYNKPADDTQDNDYITYKGKKYKYNHSLRTILFMGVDKTEAPKEQEAGQGGQTDSLILMVMNPENQTTTLLEISRDTMTDIKTYDKQGTYLGKERTQIALQYAYGNGERRSCQLTKEAVSNLLYEVPIHSYAALTIEGISVVTDAIGGVKITVPKDYTDINPIFRMGAAITLNGEQAEQYVRSRDTDVTGSNSERMERQSQFMEALAAQMQEKSQGGSRWYLSLFEKAGAYMITDIATDELERLSKYRLSETIEVLPGTVQQGEMHDEFIVDNEKMQEMMIKLFYKSVE